MNRTIEYYDKHAGEYFRATAGADFNALRRKFISYLPEHARIIDIGCGSGRDVKAFCDMGYQAIGLDASEKMAREAMEQLGIEVISGDMADWICEEPFDGVWCCAALLHLYDEDADRFLQNLRYNLKPGGILFLSVKEGIETGYDEKGRYMRNFTGEELRERLEKTGMQILETGVTADKLGRDAFRWMNIFAERKTNV